MNDPCPPPMTDPPAFIPLPRSRPALVADFSDTDSRTVAAISLLAASLAGLCVYTPVCPIASAPAFVLAIFSKPSSLRSAAIIGSIALFVLYGLWMIFLVSSMAREPLLRDFRL